MTMWPYLPRQERTGLRGETTYKASGFNIDQGLEQYWASDVTPVALPFVSREFNYSILPTLKATARRTECTVDQYKSMWIHAWDVTNQLFNALHSCPTEEKRKSRAFFGCTSALTSFVLTMPPAVFRS